MGLRLDDSTYWNLKHFLIWQDELQKRIVSIKETMRQIVGILLEPEEEIYDKCIKNTKNY